MYDTFFASDELHMVRRLPVTFTFLLLLSVFISCSSDSKRADVSTPGSNTSSAQSNTGAGNQQGAGVIQFEALDVSGKRHRSDKWIGKQPVVLNFWGTWCGPCRVEIPELVRLYKEYAPQGIEMIGLAVNDTPDRVKMFSQQYGMRWVMLMADKDLLIKYRVVTGIPQTIFLDKNGREVNRFIGARRYETLKQGFEAIL